MRIVYAPFPGNSHYGNPVISSTDHDYCEALDFPHLSVLCDISAYLQAVLGDFGAYPLIITVSDRAHESGITSKWD